MTGNIGLTTVGRSGDVAAPLRRVPLYAQAEKVLEDLLVHRRYRVGDRIPPEVELVRSLGVSRATIRAGVGRLVDRGLLIRRQGSGTYLAQIPERRDQPSPVGIKLGSSVAQVGRLETFTSIAERLGLKIDSEHLHVSAARSTPEEADALELPANEEVTRVSRVLLLDGEAAAWMIDVLPADLIPAAKVKEHLSSHQMVLDLLLDEGIPVAFSEVEVSTALLDPGEEVGGFLGLSQPVAALMLTETMYLDSAVSAEGRPAQWSRDYFLPGKLSLRLVRDTPTDRDPDIVLQLFADTSPGLGRRGSSETRSSGRKSGLSLLWHHPHQNIRRGCRVHAVGATWLGHPRLIRGAGPGGPRGSRVTEISMNSGVPEVTAEDAAPA